MRRTGERPHGFPSRLQLLVDMAGGIQRCADFGGVSRRTLGNWLREVGDPTPAAVERFAEQIGVDSAWLRRGEGSAPTQLGAMAPVAGVALTPIRDPGVRSIMSVDANWLHWRLGTEADAVFLLHAPDDSMSPRIEMGEPVLARKSKPGDVSPGTLSALIYVVEVDGEVILRTIKTEGRKTILVPANKTYGETTPKKFQIIGRALWTGKSLAVLASVQKRGARPGESPL